ncbi:MAG: nicotinate-nucleotide adenylyltransferase [Bryobacteraceae bacterium]
MRVAIFGGAFDPIHAAHLTVAREAASLCQLDRILVVPAANPPHKRLHAAYEHRYRMVEMAVAGNPVLEASRLEAETTHSYSIDTIERLRARIDPGDELFFLIGADAFAEIRTWVRWQDVIRMVEFMVVSRPGFRYDAPEGARVHRLDSLALPIASSDLRQRLAAGETPAEIPSPVIEYIREHGLYR